MEFEEKTRGGHLVRIYATDAGGIQPIHGAIYNAERKEWEIKTWEKDGSFYDSKTISIYDLILKWEPKNGEPVWVSNDKKIWYPRVSKGRKEVYSNFAYEAWPYVEPWNNGTPPTGK